MAYYPVFLDIAGRPCLVVGGGKVAERKVRSLLSAGADVTVLSPRLTEGLKRLVSKKGADRVRHIPRRYSPGDLEGYFLVISATNSKETNRQVYEDAEDFNVLLNVVDHPDACNFIVPSVVERGELKVAISTSGKSPFLAKTLRNALENALPQELVTFVEILGAVRNKLLKEGAKSDKKTRIYRTLVDSPMLEWIAGGSAARINRFLREVLGNEYTLSKLGIRLKR